MKRLPIIISATVIICAVVTSYAISILSFQKLLSPDDKINAAFLLASIFLTTVAIERSTVLANIQRILRQLVDEAAGTKTRLTNVRQFQRMEDLAEGTTDLLLVGLTKMGGITERTAFFSDLVKQGCRVRIAVLDPSVENLYGIVAGCTNHSSERLLLDIQQTQETIAAVRKALSFEENERLQVRFYGFAPTAGILKATSNRSMKVQVYFYPYKTDPIERLGLEIDRKSDVALYDYFAIRYEAMWRDIAHLPDPTLISARHEVTRNDRGSSVGLATNP